jgi:hypothetical protein
VSAEFFGTSRGLGPHVSRRGLLHGGLAIGTLALGQRAADPTTVITRGSTYDNRANLAPDAERQAVEFGVEIRRVTTAWSGFNGVGFNAS